MLAINIEVAKKICDFIEDLFHTAVDHGLEELDDQTLFFSNFQVMDFGNMDVEVACILFEYRHPEYSVGLIRNSSDVIEQVKIRLKDEE